MLACDRQTDGQTDRRTDVKPIAISNSYRLDDDDDDGDEFPIRLP